MEAAYNDVLAQDIMVKVLSAFYVTLTCGSNEGAEFLQDDRYPDDKYVVFGKKYPCRDGKHSRIVITLELFDILYNRGTLTVQAIVDNDLTNSAISRLVTMCKINMDEEEIELFLKLR